ncbi:MAG TPA: tetratricopeptide repeat protein [Ignavibacteriaceae bacterium]
MKKIIFVVILSFIFSFNLFSQQITDKQLQVGLDKIYNFNWDDGFNAFNSIIKKHPDDPSGYHYKSIIFLWYYLGNLNETNLDSFNYFSDKALELANQKLNSKTTAEIKYLIGSIYYNKSIAEARSGNYLQALWTSNQMKSNLEEAIKIKPNLYDAFLGLGLYNFALSQIPSTLEWAANLVGITADKELGLNYVKMTVQKGKLSRIDAQYYLSQLYSRVIVDHPAAKELLNNLVKRYPKNLLFNFSLAWVEYEMNDLANAEKHLRTVIKSEDELYPFVVSNANYVLGNVFFARSQFDSAKTYYNNYIKSAINDDYKGYTNFQIGLCTEILGNRKEAVKYYEKSSTGNSDIEEDLYAERKGSDYENRKMTNSEIRLIRFYNLIKQNKLSAAKDSLENFIEQNKINNDLKAEAKLYLSEICFKQKKYQEALDYAVDCIKTDVENEQWVHAYAYYLGAWSSYSQKKYIDAKLFLDQISEMDDYDFRNSLENKIYSLQRLLPK